MTPGEKDILLARKARMVGIVIAATMILWLGVNFVGASLGLDGSYALLFDFAALAAFVWALVNIYQIWRARQDS